MKTGRPAPIAERPGARPGAAVPGATVVAAAAAALTLARAGGLPWWPAVLFVALATAAVLIAFLARAHDRPFGLANGVTLFRLDLAACLLAAAWVGPAEEPGGAGHAWAVFIMAGLALTLDGIDGWLARRRGETSAFGARFDMIGDTFFAVVLSLCTLRFTTIGTWVLAVGLLRPAFVAAGRIWPGLGAPLPASPGRRAACGTALFLLVLALAPVLAPVASWLAAASLLILLLSFGRDILSLLGRR